MNKIIIEFDADNAAFEDDFHGETQFVLTQVQGRLINEYPSEFSLRDSNGNAIGTCKSVIEEN